MKDMYEKSTLTTRNDPIFIILYQTSILMIREIQQSLVR